MNFLYTNCMEMSLGFQSKYWALLIFTKQKPFAQIGIPLENMGNAFEHFTSNHAKSI